MVKELHYVRYNEITVESIDRIEIMDYTDLHAMIAVDSPNWLVINLGQVPFLYSPFNDLEEYDLLDSDATSAD